MKLKRIYLTYKISRCNFNKDTAGFVPIFWRLFPFWFIPLVVLRWESSEILGQVNPYFYQHLPDNLSGEEEPTPSMENNLCPPLCLKVKAELKDKKRPSVNYSLDRLGQFFVIPYEQNLFLPLTILLCSRNLIVQTEDQSSHCCPTFSIC